MHQIDNPIDNYDDDKLNFKPFAEKTASAILNYNQKESLIISIEGKWGSGKTSLINLIKKELTKENINDSKFNKIKKFFGFDSDKIKIMHFSPWLLTDVEQVTHLFFNELKVLLKNENRIIKLVSDFEDKLTLDNVKLKVPFAHADFKVSSKSLEDIKLEINNLLQNYKKKIIVIIDDIDRLTDKETEFIFRLTKGIADFDNLTYILLYDKKVVTTSLETFKKEDGERYLEKIVQYSLSIPKPHATTIQSLLFEKLDVILSELEKEGKDIFFDKEKWSYIANKVVNKFVLTIRDINKIVNIMSFEYTITAEDVNFSDFFLISLLKIKNIKLYQLIQENPRKFFINPELMILDKDKKQTKEDYEKIILDYPAYEELLNLLFPTLDEDEFGYTQEPLIKDHKTRYISDAYYFENYFSFSMSDDKLTYKEFKEVEKCFSSDNFDDFKAQIINLDKTRKSTLFSSMFYQLSLENINGQTKYINTFFNAIRISSQLEEGLYDKQMSWTFINPMHRFIRLSYDILRKIADIDNFLLDFYKNNVDIPLYVKCFLFDLIEKNIKKDSHEKIEIDEETQTEILEVLQDNLRNIKLNKILDESFDGFNLVFLYKKYSLDLVELSKELSSFMFKNNENFFLILDKVKYWQMSSSGNEYLINKNILIELNCLDQTIDFITNIKKYDLEAKQKELLEIWDKENKF